jgi:prolyl-tRNA synthetase
MMRLAEPLDAYHVMFTPEPMIHDLAALTLLSYKQLPLRFCYHLDFFRDVKDAKGILKSRQFKTFVGTSIDADSNSVAEAIKLFRDLTTDILSTLAIQASVVRGRNGSDWETFYFGSEGESLELPELEMQGKVKALSLAMAYQYCPDKKLGGRYQNRRNKKKRVLMTTYGLGVQRLFFAVFDSCRDALGFALPAAVRPFDMVVIPKDQRSVEEAEQVYEVLRGSRYSVLLDDRMQHMSGLRAAFSDYLGIPMKIVVNGQEMRIGRRGTRAELPVTGIEQVISQLSDMGS